MKIIDIPIHPRYDFDVSSILVKMGKRLFRGGQPVLIFATIFGVGFLLLMINLVFSHDTDMGAGHDFSGGGHDTDGTHGPSIFSVRMVSLLMVGFGALSFGVRATTEASMFTASMAGVVGAVAVGAVGYFIIRAFYASQASSTITDQDIVGCLATLLDGIAEKGYGQIACILRGREITFMATSKDGRAIPKGTQVRVVGKSGNAVIVEAVS